MNSRRWRQFRPATEQFEKRELLTITTTILSDFSPGEVSSELSEFQASGDLLYFDVNESEFWRTDGAQSGTLKLADVNRVGEFLDAGDLKLFNVVNDGSRSLWRTNGTPEGTFELLAGRGLSHDDRRDGQVITQVVQLGDEIFLSMLTGENDNRPTSQLFRTDGTREGTQLVTNSAASVVATSDAVYYINQSQTISVIKGLDTEPQELSLPGGWFEFQNPTEVDSPGVLIEPRDAPRLFATNDKLVFTTTPWDDKRFSDGTEKVTAWSSDGTGEGTQQLAREAGRRDDPSYICCSEEAQVGDQLLIPFSNGTFLSTDGTPEGTLVFPHIGRDNSRYLGEWNGRAYFDFFSIVSLDSTTPMYSSDGHSFRLEEPSSYTEVRIDDDSFVFHSVGFDNDSPAVTYIFDEAGRTNLHTPTIQELRFPTTANVGSTWYFQGEEYPQTQATNVLTGRMDIANDDTGADIPYPGEFLSHSNTASTPEYRNPRQRYYYWPTGYKKPIDAPLFTHDSGALFVLDGGLSREFISELPDVPRFRSGPLQHQYDAAGFFYFTTNFEEFGTEVWVSDGTAEGTTVIDLYPGPTSSEPNLVNWDGRTLIAASTPKNGKELLLITIDDLQPDDVIDTFGHFPDADGDGQADFTDFLILSSNYGRVDAAFADGDFTGDNKVDFADFLLLAANFGRSV